MVDGRRAGDWAAWLGAPAPERSERVGRVVGPAPAPAVRAARGAEPARLPSDPLAAAAAPEPSPDSPRSPRREATRQRILDAARQVFAERGVIGGTVEDICERAGFTRGAFYSNFTDKDDVVEALVEREHDRLLEHLDASFAAVDRDLAEADDLPAVVASIVDRILRSVPIDRQLSLVQTELEIFAVRRPELAGRFVEINQRFRERIGRFLAEAMHRHGRELLVDVPILTDAIVAITERSVRRALLAGGEADPDAMASAILPGLLLAFSRPVPEAREP